MVDKDLNWVKVQLALTSRQCYIEKTVGYIVVHGVAGWVDDPETGRKIWINQVESRPGYLEDTYNFLDRVSGKFKKGQDVLLLSCMQNLDVLINGVHFYTVENPDRFCICPQYGLVSTENKYVNLMDNSLSGKFVRLMNELQQVAPKVFVLAMPLLILYNVMLMYVCTLGLTKKEEEIFLSDYKKIGKGELRKNPNIKKSKRR